MVMADSGADHCVFPLSFMRGLGLDSALLNSQLTGGLGNASNRTYYAAVEIDLGQGILIKTYAGFTNGLESIGWGLLGQTGFFDQFTVVFDYRAGLFHVE
jgi:hypothetical protein